MNKVRSAGIMEIAKLHEVVGENRSTKIPREDSRVFYQRIVCCPEISFIIGEQYTWKKKNKQNLFQII